MYTNKIWIFDSDCLFSLVYVPRQLCIFWPTRWRQRSVYGPGIFWPIAFRFMNQNGYTKNKEYFTFSFDNRKRENGDRVHFCFHQYFSCMESQTTKMLQDLVVKHY